MGGTIMNKKILNNSWLRASKKWGVSAVVTTSVAVAMLTASSLIFSGKAQAAKTCDTPNKLCGSELTVFDYGGDDVIGWVPDYAKKYPAKPRWSTFVDTNEALQKMKGGFQVDIVHLTNSDNSAANPYWIDYIQPWDIKKITGWNDIYPFWKNAPGFEPIKGQYYMIPTLFGMTAVVYDTKYIKPGEIKSLKDFADPKYKGRVVMPDSAYEVFAFCLLAEGNKKPFVQITKADVDRCDPFLRAIHKNVRQYFSDSGGVVAGFKTGELRLGFVWMDVPYTINKERQKDPKGNRDMLMLDRNLGFSLWAMGMVRTKTSKPEVTDLAYDYTNALINGGADFLVHEFGYGSVNKKAMAALEAKEPNVLKDRFLDNIESYVKRGKGNIMGALSVDTNQYLMSQWEKIKTGS